MNIYTLEECKSHNRNSIPQEFEPHTKAGTAAEIVKVWGEMPNAKRIDSAWRVSDSFGIQDMQEFLYANS